MEMMLSLEVLWTAVAESGVDAGAVKPADVLDDGELELGAGAPDAIADELGLERVDERFGQRVDAPMSRAEAFWRLGGRP
jgi:hypothetical protein